MIFKKKTNKENKQHGPLRRAFTPASTLLLSLILISAPLHKANAIFCAPCSGCMVIDCTATGAAFEATQSAMTPIIEKNIEHHLNSEQNWIIKDFFEDFWVKGLAELTEYLGAFGMKQVEMFGMFLDAKNQLETQRLYHELQAEAHRDYHPSEGICAIGTNARSLAASESKGTANILSLSMRSIMRGFGTGGSSSAGGFEQDASNRWRQFVTTYCDPKDNGWSEPGTGLDLACDHDGATGGAKGAASRDRMNKDISYTTMVDEPKTIDFDLSDTTLQPGDIDVMAMSANLYGNRPLLKISRESLKNEPSQRLYLALRSVMARRNVAANSFNTIAAMKSEGAATGGVEKFMGAALHELMPAATSAADIYKIIGEHPSYYAQLELISKKIYESPDFFADLYDKPANIARKSVAMKGIDLMLDRALLESELRQEMLLSVLLSTEMRKEYRKLNKTTSTQNVEN